MSERLRVRSVAGAVVALFALMAPSMAAAQAGGRGDYHVRLNPAAIDYGIVSSGDLDTGQILMGTIAVRIQPRGRSNWLWNLSVQADAGQFGPGNKPSGHVQWQLAGSTVWQSASTGSQLVAQGNGNQSVNVSFRIIVDWDDAPGDYSAPLTFLATRQ